MIRGKNPIKFFLKKGFKDELREKPVNWGYDGLSEFTFYRTYSRKKNNGQLETWADCVIRVIEGMFSILKTHCITTGLPWNENKAHKHAEEAASRLLEFKWTPPGRGLWMMGTDFVWERGGASLNNPLHIDTEVLTKEYGWIALKNIPTDSVTVLSKLRGKNGNFTGNTGWFTATKTPIENHTAYEITYTSSFGNEYTVIASENHRWFRKATTKLPFERVTTTELKEKQWLPRSKPSITLDLSYIGVAHGYFFGDGTRSNGELHQFTEDNKKILKTLFSETYFRDSDRILESGLTDLVVKNLPLAWGKVPTGDYLNDTRYIYGFLAGYFAADGKISNYSISSARKEELEQVRDLFWRIGVETSAVELESTTSNYSDDRKLYILKLNRYDLPEQFFIKEEHKEIARKRKKPKYEHHLITKIKKLNSLQEVMCLTTPEHENFTINGFCSTSNCAFVSTENIDIEMSKPFAFLMDMSMLGVGVGFDTKGADKAYVYEPEGEPELIVVEDSREGWVELISCLIDSYLDEGSHPIIFDTSKVRAYGEPIRGFGGVASGPKPLEQGFYGIQSILNNRIGQFLTSTDIVDIMNIIGKIVVAGNVRRCLPINTLIHTEKGLIKIQDIKPGDKVYTSSGLAKVSENVYQGEQEVITVKTQLGEFKCTPKHKIAILSSVNEYEWIQAQYLKEGDRLVFPEHIIEGKITTLPEWQYDKPKGSTTCKDIIIPNLDENMSWLFGLFHGDGNTYPNFKNNGSGSYISIACDRINYPSIVTKAKEQLQRFSPELNFCDVEEKLKDKSYKIRIASKQLSWYLAKFKEANKTINVPDFILQGTKNIRASYLAGLFDADGSAKNRPTIAVYTIYEEYAKQVQALYASLGIPTRIKRKTRKEKNWQDIYLVSVVGEDSIEKFEQIVGIYSEKYENYNKTNRSQNDYGYPSSWITKDIVRYGKSWTKQQKQMTYHKFKSLQGDSNLIPIKVESIENTNELVDTYDLSVPDANEFIAAEGLLVHNTAEIGFAEPDDVAFMEMKNWKKFPVEVGAAPPEELRLVSEKDYELYKQGGDLATMIANSYQDEKWAYKFGGWRWASNNSLFGTVGMDYTKAAESIAVNGEPGFAWLENMQKYGRMKDGVNNKDHKVRGGNPCLEQSLEPYELCCLVETYPNNHEDYWDFQRTLKFAYMYAKAVTLMMTHWEETNAVMIRNRRIGCSQSGIIQAIYKFGRRRYLDEFCDRAYDYIQYLDTKYADWLGVPKSIKTTSVKPSGTVSLLAGAYPGIHYTESDAYYRTVRVAAISPIVDVLKKANYRVEPAVSDPYKTIVVYFPVIHRENAISKKEVSIWEQFKNAADMQYYWADNQVSITVTFKQNEADQIARCLSAFDHELKGISLLPIEEHGYAQAPYIPAPREEIEAYKETLLPLDFSTLNDEGENAQATKFCEGDQCMIN